MASLSIEKKREGKRSTTTFSGKRGNRIFEEERGPSGEKHALSH